MLFTPRRFTLLHPFQEYILKHQRVGSHAF